MPAWHRRKLEFTFVNAKSQVWEALDDAVDTYPRFSPREVRTQAEVNAVAEANVTIG